MSIKKIVVSVLILIVIFGLAGFLEVSPPIARATTPNLLPGDINGNSRVDIFDYNIVLTNFNISGVGYAGGDIDSSGKVDIFDYNILLTNFARNLIIVDVSQGSFRTINSALAEAKPGSIIQVMPGIYNEQIVLKNGVNFYLEDGAVIDYSAVSNQPTITDGSSAATVTIDGMGVIKRSGSNIAAIGIDLENDNTSLNLKCKQVDVSIDLWNAIGIFVNHGNLNLACDVSARGIAVRINSYSENSSLQGNFYSGIDYGILAGGGNVIVTGNITAEKNSAMHCSSGHCEFSGTATSNGLFGFEMSGGTALIHDATIISNVNNGRLEEEDGINKYGGEGLTLDNVKILTKGVTARSIGEQGRIDSVTILRTSYANKPKSDKITISGGELIIDPNLTQVSN